MPWPDRGANLIDTGSGRIGGGESALQERNGWWDAFPAAVCFTEASWNPTEPAKVDATSASKQVAKLASVSITECCLCFRTEQALSLSDVEQLSFELEYIL